jgi:hypothetical protein
MNLFFLLQYIWRVNQKSGVMQGYPNLIASFLKGICHAHIDRVDAIYERPDGSLIVFHGI